MPTYRPNIADAEYCAARKCPLDGQVVVHRFRSGVIGAEDIQRQRFKVRPIGNWRRRTCRGHEGEWIRLSAAKSTGHISIWIGKTRVVCAVRSTDCCGARQVLSAV